MRNRRRTSKLGPLIIYGKDQGLTKAFRNIPGVSLISVNKLNLMKLAPGGHVGRFCIWTESAFQRLNALYGTWRQKSKLKSDYNLPQPLLTGTDLSRLLKSDEIQKVIRRPRQAFYSINFFRLMMKPLLEHWVMNPCDYKINLNTQFSFS
jgi:large subunit ribosomal protein L4e